MTIETVFKENIKCHEKVMDMIYTWGLAQLMFPILNQS